MAASQPAAHNLDYRWIETVCIPQKDYLRGKSLLRSRSGSLDLAIVILFMPILAAGYGVDCIGRSSWNRRGILFCFSSCAPGKAANASI